MALDSGKETRRPHTQAEAEAEQRALEERIINDKQMADKFMDKAMNSRRTQNTGAARGSEETVSRRTGGTDSLRRTSVRGQQTDRRTAEEDRRPRRSLLSERAAGTRRTETGKRRTVPLQKPESRSGVRELNNTEEGQFDADFERRIRAKKKKAFRIRILSMILVELLTLVCIFGFGFVYRYMHMTAEVDFDVEKVRNENIDITQKQKMSGYWTVAVFGVDSRTGDVGKGANADVQIIANIDMGTGDVTLVSVYRDTYLYLGKNSRYAKCNAAYAEGGPEQAVAMLNENLDLNIENYVTFNWKAVADAIDLLGGVDIDVSKAAFYYMNAYIHETCIKSGISAENPAAMYIKEAGMQHLNGVQAVAYARLRYMDNDFERTKRQREVIAQCLEHAKQTDLATLTKIIDTVLPQVAFNIDTADIIELAKGISRYNIKESVGFPQELKDQMMGKKGDCVIPTTLKSNVVWLHSVLFADEDYSVSNAVEKYSQKIADDSGYYATHKETEETSEKKFTKSNEDETEKSTSETKESSSSKKQKTDKDGYLIKGTDADGKYIYETDEDGNKIKSKETTEASETKKSDKSESGKAETDADGNTIKKETDESKKETSKETKETKEGETESREELIDESTSSSKETKKSSEETTKETAKETTKETKETTKETVKETTKSSKDTSETVEEPGKQKETTAAEGPTPGSGGSSNAGSPPGSSTDGPGSDSSDDIIQGPM